MLKQETATAGQHQAEAVKHKKYDMNNGLSHQPDIEKAIDS